MAGAVARGGVRMNKDVLFSSKTDLWETPQDFFDMLDAEFGFTLDAAADAQNHKCPCYYTREQDGLKQPWPGAWWYCRKEGKAMDDQMQLFDISEKQSSNNTGKAKRKWENGFQRWSDRHSADGGSSFGCCGFGSMCDYCDDNTYGRPCVRSLNAMIREKRLKIDYEKTGYVEAWEGILDND